MQLRTETSRWRDYPDRLYRIRLHKLCVRPRQFPPDRSERSHCPSSSAMGHAPVLARELSSAFVRKTIAVLLALHRACLAWQTPWHAPWAVETSDVPDSEIRGRTI